MCLVYACHDALALCLRVPALLMQPLQELAPLQLPEDAMKSYTQLAEAHAALEQLLEVGAMQRQQCDCCFCDEFLMGQEPHDLSSEAAYAVGWVHAGQGPHDLSLAPRTGHAEGAVQGQGSRGWHGRCVCCIQEPGSHKQYHLVRGLISGCQASGRF